MFGSKIFMFMGIFLLHSIPMRLPGSWSMWLLFKIWLLGGIIGVIMMKTSVFLRQAEATSLPWGFVHRELWQYGEITGNYFSLDLWEGERHFFPAINKSTIRYFGKAYGDQVSLNTDNMAVNKTYVVRLVMTKDNRNSTAHQVIHLVEGNPPKINQK